MPLQLGDASTDRGQVIVYDAASEAQVTEAQVRCDLLLKQGFTLKEQVEGKIILDHPPRDINFGMFRILSENGDDRIVWDRRKPDEVRDAYKKFKDFLAKGYRAYTTMADGKKGHHIDDFDPGLEEIFLSDKSESVLMVPPTIPG